MASLSIRGYSPAKRFGSALRPFGLALRTFRVPGLGLVPARRDARQYVSFTPIA